MHGYTNIRFIGNTTHCNMAPKRPLYPSTNRIRIAQWKFVSYRKYFLYTINVYLYVYVYIYNIKFRKKIKRIAAKRLNKLNFSLSIISSPVNTLYFNKRVLYPTFMSKNEASHVPRLLKFLSNLLRETGPIQTARRVNDASYCSYLGYGNLYINFSF